MRRGHLFSKLGKAIAIAARDGSDPNDNFKLRMAMDTARQANMPKDNVERAIKRGAGEIEGVIIEETMYEGYGPDGVALIIHALTDNKNRTVAEIRHILGSCEGSIGNTGSVLWQFSQKGVIRIPRENISSPNTEEFQLKLIDAGADDVRDEKEGLVILTNPKKLEEILMYIVKEKFEVASSGIELIANTPLDISDKTKSKIEKLIEVLEEHEDVNAVYTNANV